MHVSRTIVRRARIGVLGAVVAAGGLATLGGGAAGAAPTTLFVDNRNPSCSDAGSGTSAVPLCTVVRAAQLAVAGQTVSVAAGTYAGGIAPARSGTASARIAYVAAPGVTVRGGTNGFRLASRSYVNVQGFTVADTTGTGIDVSSSSSIVLFGNHVTQAGEPVNGQTARGIRLLNTSSSLVWANTTDHNSDAGIGVVGTASTGNQIVGNTSYDNARGYVRAAAGIDVRDGSGTTLTSNVTHDNEDSGLNVWTGSSATVASDNVSYRNGDHGIDVHDALNATVVANTVSGNVDSGIEVTTSIGTTIANNVSTDNGINSPRTSGNVRVDAPSAASTNLDDDLVFLRVAGVMFDWAGVRYSSLAAFSAATGRELHGRQGDPRFVNATGGNFRIASGSAAIDGADTDVAGQPAADADNHARFDDPATVNTGSGPVRYADRGAFEYHP